jgi:hypothetical protein
LELVLAGVNAVTAAPCQGTPTVVGVFRRIEGAIDHQIIRIHHAREAPNATMSNLTCLTIEGVRCILLGWLLMRTGSRAAVGAHGARARHPSSLTATRPQDAVPSVVRFETGSLEQRGESHACR